MCTPLPVRGPRAARVPSRELGTLSAPGIHKGIIELSVRVRFTDAQHEGEVIDQDSTVILRRSTIREYAFRPGKGTWLGSLYDYQWRGRVVEVPWVVWFPVTRWIRDMPSPR